MGKDRTPVYLYIDEAGNFDFSPKGSKYLILTCAVMRRKFEHLGRLSDIKYDCLEHGLPKKKQGDSFEFHAADDWQKLRDKVFNVIEQIPDLGVYSIVIRKNKTNPSLHRPEKLYPRAFDWLLQDVRRIEGIDESYNVVVITDSVNFKGKNDVLKSSLLSYLDKEIASKGSECSLYQHRSCSDLNLQVVDYCSWAIQRYWEMDDASSLDIIRQKIKHIGDPFRNGDTIYYRYKEKK